MIHDALIIKNVSLFFFHKSCFENFSTQIYYGQKIGIIGRNGNGKTTLLNIIQGLTEPSQGQIITPKNVLFGYVPQLTDQESKLSGGQSFNHMLSQALAKQPNILCLDEPTNNLDLNNRQTLMRMLTHFKGTLIVVSHETQLLETCVNQIWHLDEGKVKIFSGTYQDYLKEQQTNWEQRTQKIESLKKEVKKAREAFEFEKQRAAKRKNIYKYENDKLLRGAMRERGTGTTGKNQGKINALKNEINQELQASRLPEVITPTFTLNTADLRSHRELVTITNGSCGYDKPIITNINLHLHPQERIAILGDNGSGKTTIIKALLSNQKVVKSGTWLTPKQHEIGYLDQQYATLTTDESVLDTVKKIQPTWTTHQLRKHLNDFLFRKNEEINALTQTLSGGERARLSLAQIAAQSPRLLILDEVTNNLDQETRMHVIQVLQAYPGALIVISHDNDFLQKIDIQCWYLIENNNLLLKS